MLAAAVSYVRALGNEGNTTAVEQSVEWLRGHNFGDTVSWAERLYYSHNQPPTGGRVLYVASAGLSVRTLAALLQRAGAVRAMELDINHSWVSFNAFHHEPSGSLTGTKLLAGMSKSASRYLHPDSRDFVAVIARATIGQV
ncbi:MAG: hypothetical protein ABIR32_23495 [Ilumatobacteraceae bacterium]